MYTISCRVIETFFRDTDQVKNKILYYKNMVYEFTLIEYERVMCWILILEVFGTDHQHIDGVYNILSDTNNIILNAKNNQTKASNNDSQVRSEKLFTTGKR